MSAAAFVAIFIGIMGAGYLALVVKRWYTNLPRLDKQQDKMLRAWLEAKKQNQTHNGDTK